jgi:hypothetical protein
MGSLFPKAGLWKSIPVKLGANGKPMAINVEFGGWNRDVLSFPPVTVSWAKIGGQIECLAANWRPVSLQVEQEPYRMGRRWLNGPG